VTSDLALHNPSPRNWIPDRLADFAAKSLFWKILRISPINSKILQVPSRNTLYFLDFARKKGEGVSDTKQ
jgi:hypothetical protein